MMKIGRAAFPSHASPSPRWAGLYVLALACALALIAGCGNKPLQKTVPPAVVKVALALDINVPQTWEYAGEIKPRYETTLSFRVAGKIAQRLVNLGDSVDGASVVARLDTVDLKLASAQADSTAEQAKAQARLAAEDLVRYRDLFSRDLVARAELEHREAAALSASAQLSAVQAAAAQAANGARYGNLVAGQSGVVTAVMVEAGQVVTAGQPVMQIAQTKEIEAAFAVPETQIRNIERGQAVMVRVVGSDVQRSGRIREIAGMTDPVGRTYGVRVQLDPNSQEEGGLRLGMSASITIHSSRKTASKDGEQAAFVPLSAVVGEENANYVLVIEKGKAVKRAVQVQQVAPDNLIRVSGVRPGETVVSAGAQFVSPGSAVALMQNKGRQS